MGFFEITFYFTHLTVEIVKYLCVSEYLKWSRCSSYHIFMTLPLTWQWHIQRLSDASIPVWAPKVEAQIKGELLQNNIGHSIIYSTETCVHVLRHWFKDLVYACVCNTILFKHITIYCLFKRIQHFCSTGLPKLSPGYDPAWEHVASSRSVTSLHVMVKYTSLITGTIKIGQN